MNDSARASADFPHAKSWLKSYLSDTPSEIDPSQLPTLKAMCESACARHADSPAITQGERSLSFAELEALSRAFGAWLQSVGATKGDRIALMLPNILEYPVALFGALRVGMVIVNLNPMYTPSEVEQLLNDSEPVVLVTLSALHRVVAVRELHFRLRYVITIGGSDADVDSVKQPPTESECRYIPWSQAVRATSEHPLKAEGIEPTDLAFIQYTGGTTGSPKGVMLTHRNVCANILQGAAWIHAFTETQKTLITLLPLYHIFALEGSLLLFAHLGWRNVFVTDPRNLAGVIAELARYPVAFLSGVNTLFRGLISTPGFSSLDFSQLKITLSGGMATEPQVARRWYEITGCHVTQAWGLTETSPGACINLPGTPFNGTVGLPIPSTEIAIRDEVGRDLPLGEVGEICVRGPQVMRGYWHRPEDTAQAFWPDSWLRTGDVGRVDERGFVYLIERLKDVIVVSGFKVYPQEVEAVAIAYPGVLEAAVTSQPDPASSETVALFVVCAGRSIDQADLLRHCRRSLTPYKVPKHLYIRAALPKSPVGKVLRKVLRDELLKAFVE
jgi:long-chain acyl-CoA synthetase